jgi:hypothetical protein
MLRLVVMIWIASACGKGPPRPEPPATTDAGVASPTRADDHRVVSVRAMNDDVAIVGYEIVKPDSTVANRRVAAFRPGKTSPLWQHDLEHATADDLLSNLEANSGVVLWRELRGNAAKITAWDGTSGETLWTRPVFAEQGDRGSMTILGDRAVIVERETLRVLELRTGKQVMEYCCGGTELHRLGRNGTWIDLDIDVLTTKARRRFIETSSGRALEISGTGQGCVVDDRVYDLIDSGVRITELAARGGARSLPVAKLKLELDTFGRPTADACAYRRDGKTLRLVYATELSGLAFVAIDITGNAATLAWSIPELETTVVDSHIHIPLFRADRSPLRGELARSLVVARKLRGEKKHLIAKLDLVSGTRQTGSSLSTFRNSDLAVWRAGTSIVVAHHWELLRDDEPFHWGLIDGRTGATLAAFEVPGLQCDVEAMTDRIAWLWSSRLSTADNLPLARIDLASGKVLDRHGDITVRDSPMFRGVLVTK